MSLEQELKLYIHKELLNIKEEFLKSGSNDINYWEGRRYSLSKLDMELMRLAKKYEVKIWD